MTTCDLPIRFRQRIRHRSAARHACRRAATRRRWSRTACTPNSCQRHRVHRAAAQQPAQLAVPHPPGGDARPFALLAERAFHNDFADGPVTPEPAALVPLPMPTAPHRFHRRPVHHGRQRRPGAGIGVGIHVYAANASMDGRFFYNADGEMLIVPQQGRLRIAHRNGRAGDRAAGNRGDPARHPLRVSICSTAARAATCARTSAPCCACRIWARSVATAWPIRAIS